MFSDQISEISVADVEALLVAMKTHDRPVRIDWVNRSIRILSDVIVHPTKKMSRGEPMAWRDILYSVKGYN